VIVCGGLVWALVGILYSGARTVGPLVPLAFAMGLGRGIQWTGLLSSAGSLSNPRTRGRIISTLSTFDILGYCPGPVIGGILAEKMGPGAPFLALAALEAMSALVVMALCKEGRRQSLKPAQPGMILKQSTPAQRGLPKFFYLVAAGQFMIFFGASGTFGTIMPLIGVSRCGLTPSEVGGALSVGLVLMVVSIQIAGRCFDAGLKWQALAGGTCAGVVSMAVLARAQTAGTFTGAIAGMVFASGFVYTVPPALAAGLAGQSGLGGVMGLLQTAGDAGNCAGPVIQGLVSDLAGGNYAVPVLLHASIYFSVFISLAAALRKGLEAGPSDSGYDQCARHP